jgi:heavy metal sensor kinase
MRSIRLSLAVYFVLLLTVALGAMSAVVYHAVAAALQDKAEVNRALVWAQCEEQCRARQEQFDDELLTQARSLAAEAQPLFQPTPARLLSVNPLGALTAAAGPFGHAATPFHIAQGVRSPLTWHLSGAVSTDLPFNDTALGDGSETEFAQINAERGNVWRSSSLRPNRLEFDADAAWKLPLYTWKHDETVVAGVPVRRVVLKVPVSRFRYAWHNVSKRDPTLVGKTPPPPGTPPPEAGRPERPSGGPERPAGSTERPAGGPPPGGKPPPSFGESSAPPMLVQVAAPTARRDHDIVELLAERDRQLLELQTTSDAGLARLRWELFAVAAITLTATMVGGLALVGFGLAPLSRLSEAVSRITPKNFRLKLDPSRLPAELAPIAGRLAQTLQELERAFAREKQATADISHELRTPLSALLTTLEVSLRKPRSGDEYRATLSDCREVSRQLNRLVEQLLVLARMDAGTARVNRKPVEVQVVADSVATLVRPLAEQQSVTLEVTAPAGLVAATDPDRLREILTNLLHNAVEYNRPGGSVEVRAESAGGEVVVEVRDTGIGMSPEVQSHIFERFYRADPSRQETGQHSGLGLAIVKETVGLLGGRIAVESAPGVGSTFRIWLPRP